MRVYNKRPHEQVDGTGREMREDDCTYQRTGEKVCLCTAFIKIPASATRLCLTKVGFPARPSRAAFPRGLPRRRGRKMMSVHVNSCRKSCWCMWASVLDKNLHTSEIPDFSSFRYRDTASISRKTKLRGSKIQTRFLTNENRLTGRFFI